MDSNVCSQARQSLSVNPKSKIHNPKLALSRHSFFDNPKSKIQNLKLIGRVFVLVCLIGAGVVHAQPAKVGVLHLGGPFAAMVEGLRAGLKELGLAEGKQFTLDVRDLKGDAKAAASAAQQFERDRVKVIYAVATPLVIAAKQQTKDTPIVFSVGSDPVAAGFLQSFAQPGGRLTGIHYLARDLTEKRLAILRELLPKLRTIVTFYDPDNGVAVDAAKLGRDEAQRVGVKLAERPVKSVDELRAALAALKSGEFDAYFYLADPMVVSQARAIIETAKAKKLPTMFHDRSLVESGALASYGQSYYEIGRGSAKYVKSVLNGTPPRDLRVETKDDVELAINLRTAQELGVKIPPDMLARAGKVVR
jgi:putative ABC transport system substrate-binding protein